VCYLSELAIGYEPEEPMNENFLKNFMIAAKKITHAERCMVVDTDLKLRDTINIDRAMIESTAFGEFAMECLREALKSDDVVITNNIITDPSDAPTTNTNFANLRVVVAMPLKGYGALYLDQHIRSGIIPKQMVDRLMRLANHLIDGDRDDNSSDDIYDSYQDIE